MIYDITWDPLIIIRLQVTGSKLVRATLICKVINGTNKYYSTSLRYSITESNWTKLEIIKIQRLCHNIMTYSANCAIKVTKKIAALQAAFFQLPWRAAAFGCKLWGPLGPLYSRFSGRFFQEIYFREIFFRENFFCENYFHYIFFHDIFFLGKLFFGNFLGRFF